MQTRLWAGPLGGLVLALGAGALCTWIRTPLPWMIGPLFALATARLAGAQVEALPSFSTGSPRRCARGEQIERTRIETGIGHEV